MNFPKRDELSMRLKEGILLVVVKVVLAQSDNVNFMQDFGQYLISFDPIDISTGSFYE
jgi:hypothetical protein